MRKQIVAGNWKMNNSFTRGVELSSEINKLIRKADNLKCEIIVCPPFIHLAELAKLVDKDKVYIGAQNCSSEPKGAFTGEISAKMIQSTGAKYVIIGHSERRQYFKESNDILAKKVNLVLENELKAIFCIGEVLEERESENHFSVVKSQLEHGIFHLSEREMKNVVIAYEPVWAIGTGKTASPDQAQEMHNFIRKEIANKFSENLASEITILYGGSCKPSNAKELFSQSDVDGGLIGGASLDANDFFAIANSF